MPNIQTLELLARGAGEILRAGFGEQNHVQHKGEIDLVTEVDLRSEKYLLDQIGKKFPEHKILAEESGEIQGNAEHLWYIDPLDGTTNFAHELPIFSVSIGYTFGGVVKLGVVYDPMRDELFSAESGKGAWLNGVPIHVGETLELKQSLMVTGFPYDRFSSNVNNLENFSRMALKVQGIRRLGSAALDLCYVACGRVDGYWELKIAAWDIAAGILIAQEAGGKVTKMSGAKDLLSPPHSIIAANPKLHSIMIAELGGNTDN